MIISIKIQQIESQFLLTIYNYIVTYFKAPSRKISIKSFEPQIEFNILPLR